ncbi:serine-threonine protein phosphatase, putative [Bodo saltans]|uniref:Serine-threonine protein phosphatase, putative n=1 Tax=Bodo saltans TaxID=75058 RepID=A0A0S4JP80_BODSA|nr:serine-threonine protein phosphatase, putative [Bodo saltans]|eukprot:CUG90313.1 serine-threonine protein phosphatase, putative [Bodo saltans]
MRPIFMSSASVGPAAGVEFVFLLLMSCLLSLSCHGAEVLPPSAYLNRTLYPPIPRYPIKPQLSLGVLSDVQYADQDEHQRRHFRKSLEKLRHAVDEMNANRTHLDMVVHLGDLVDHSIDRFLPAVEPILKTLKYPFYQLLGNHDFLGSPEEAFDRIHSKLGMPARYYSLSAGPSKSYRLIMLDGNDIALYSTTANSAKRQLAYQWKAALKRKHRKNAQKFNGALSDEQIVWMKEQMSEACNMSQRVLIFLHHPMRPVGEPTNLWNDLEVVPIITSFPCVVGVVNGHAHKFLYDFHHTTFRDVHFVTFGGMVQSPFTSWGFVELYEDSMHVHGLVFGRPIDFRYDIRSTAASKVADVPSGGDERASEQLQGPRTVDIVSLAPSSREKGDVQGGGMTEPSTMDDATLLIGGPGGTRVLGVQLILVLPLLVLTLTWVVVYRRAWLRSKLPIRRFAAGR